MNEPAVIKTADKPRKARAISDWCAPPNFALVLAFLIVIPFWKVVVGIDTFAVRDFGIFSYPVAFFQRQCFWKGELPWWNPMSCCGLPFLAQFNTLALYPPALIYLLLPLTWSLPFFCLLHLFFGGMGMYFLASRWSGSRAGGTVAGLAFAFGGLSLNFLMWPSHIATFAWLPWVIGLTELGLKQGGRKIVPAVLAAAMQVLAGGPETILFTWLILAALGVMEGVKRTAPALVLARRFLLTGALALCLSAAQWLPSADFALHCSRNTNYATSEWSMPISGWANLLVPLFQTARWQGLALQHDQYWTSSYYTGIGVVFLAVMALWRRRVWRVWLLGGFVAAAMILALGDHAFVYLWLRRLFPMLGFFRFPIKFVIVTSALLPLLAAFAVSQYENCPILKPYGKAELVCGGLFVILVGVILLLGKINPAADSPWLATLGNGLSRLGLLAVFLWAVYFFAARPAHRWWSIVLVSLVCWADLISAVPWQNPTLHPSVYQPGLGQMTSKLAPEPAVGESRLMMSPFAAHQLYYHPPPDLKTSYLLDRATFLADCNLLDNVPKVDGFFSLYLRETDKILWMLDTRNGPELERLEDFLSVSQTIAPGKVYQWMPRTNYVPIVTAGQEPIFADDQTALDAIGKTNVDFRQVIYLPPEAKTEIRAAREPNARIVNKQFDANKAVIHVDSPTPALVCISQAYYHDWKAEVDGKLATLWRANYAFQAVEVPAGRHELTLSYQDTLFRYGAVLTGFGILVSIIYWFKFALKVKITPL